MSLRQLLVGSSLLTILVIVLMLNFRNDVRPPHPVPETLTDKTYVLKNESYMLRNESYILRNEANVPRNKTYVAACTYSFGQQGAMTHSLAALQCFLSSIGLNSAIAEPILSRGLGSPMKFSVLFDLDYFNSQSRHYGNVEMVTYQEFIQRKPKYVILVSVRERALKSSVLWSPDPTSQSKCIDQNILTKYDGFFHDLNKRKCITENCIVRVVILPMSKSIRHSERAQSDLYQLIFDDWSPQDVTVLFDLWNSNYFVPLKGAGGRECERQHSTTTYRPLFRASKKLLHDARNYEEKFLKNQSKLAIMIRSERVEKNYLKMSELDSLKKCFNKVVSLSKEIEKRENKAVFPLVTLDVGKFGSVTYRSRGEKIMKEFGNKLLETLYHNEVSVKDWTSSFTQVTGGETNPKYIAALQRTLASRADCMILMGGGNFQALAIKDYFDYHGRKKEKCIHLVCTMIKNETLDLSALIDELSNTMQ